jgi:hypothetical protein
MPYLGCFSASPSDTKVAKTLVCGNAFVKIKKSNRERMIFGICYQEDPQQWYAATATFEDTYDGKSK